MGGSGALQDGEEGTTGGEAVAEDTDVTGGHPTPFSLHRRPGLPTHSTLGSSVRSQGKVYHDTGHSAVERWKGLGPDHGRPVVASHLCQSKSGLSSVDRSPPTLFAHYETLHVHATPRPRWSDPKFLVKVSPTVVRTGGSSLGGDQGYRVRVSSVGSDGGGPVSAERSEGTCVVGSPKNVLQGERT